MDKPRRSLAQNVRFYCIDLPTSLTACWVCSLCLWENNNSQFHVGNCDTYKPFILFTHAANKIVLTFYAILSIFTLSSKAQGLKYFRKPSKSSHVGIHWIALTQYSHKSTHVPGFQYFLRFFASFCIGQISHQQHKGGIKRWLGQTERYTGLSSGRSSVGNYSESDIRSARTWLAQTTYWWSIHDRIPSWLLTH